MHILIGTMDHTEPLSDPTMKAVLDRLSEEQLVALRDWLRDVPEDAVVDLVAAIVDARIDKAMGDLGNVLRDFIVRVRLSGDPPGDEN